MSRNTTWLAPLITLALAGAGIWAIFDTPAASGPRPAAEEAPLPVVAVLPVSAERHLVRIHAWGRIQPWDARAVRAQVEGRITHLHPDFEPGGLIKTGQTLVQIEDRDYRLAVEAARAQLDKAEAQLAIEGGKRRVAREALRLLADSAPLDKRSRALALRSPQLREARAELLARKIALQQAELQLERTRIQATRDLVVLERQRSLGEVISRGQPIGRVADADRARLTLQVDPTLLPRLAPGRAVEITYQGQHYPGRVTRIRRRLSAKTRQAQITVALPDPYSRLPEHAQRPPLLLGAYVEARIQAGRLPPSLRLPRSALLEGDRVWVVDAQQRLQQRQAKVLFRTPAHAYIAPLAEGERLLRGRPAGLLPGTRVRIADPKDSPHDG